MKRFLLRKGEWNIRRTKHMLDEWTNLFDVSFRFTGEMVFPVVIYFYDAVEFPDERSK